MSISLVVFCNNKPRVSAFYQLTLELRIDATDDTHDVLRGDGMELVIHAIPREHAEASAVGTPPILREDSYLKPVFVVRNLERVRAAATATGGGLQPESKMWQIRGASVLDGWDPEGNVVQFKQRPPGA
jgi:hypothetical protein